MKSNLLFISFCSIISIAFTSELGAEVYDDFNGSQIDPTLWNIYNPDGVLSQSGGCLNTDAPPYLSGGWVTSKICLYCDFEVILDWRDFSVSLGPDDVLITYNEVGLCIMDSTNTDNQAYIVRGNESGGPDGWILSCIWKDGELLDSGLDPEVSAPSGLFKITRVGSTISLYYDVGGGWLECGAAEGAFTDPVLFHINGQTANVGDFHVSSDWIAVEAQPPVIVPYVLGMTEADAQSALEAAGLVKGEVTLGCDTVEFGLVMEQDPSAEATVACGSSVDLVISGASVPDVLGMTEADAQSALEAAGLVKGEVTLGCDTVEFGLVMEQDPSAEATVACGSSVDLVISGASVPDVLDMTKAEAEASLNTSNLITGKVTRDWSYTVPVGRVMAQNPIYGTLVSCGSSVDLVISMGPRRGGGPRPIVYWSFDNPSDPGHDDSAHGHQLIIPCSWTNVPGHAGDAIALEAYGGGTNSGPDPWGPYTSTLGMDYPGISGFTVAFWAKIEDGKTAYVQDYWQDTDYGETFNLGYQGGGEGITFMVRHDFSNSTPVLQVSSTPYIGQWIHLAGCYESKVGKVKLYVNGRLEGSATLPGEMRTSLPPYIYVNGNWDTTDPGTIDEVRIYNQALKISEIRKLAE
jgi:hypothetical protein